MPRGREVERVGASLGVIVSGPDAREYPRPPSDGVVSLPILMWVRPRRRRLLPILPAPAHSGSTRAGAPRAALPGAEQLKPVLSTRAGRRALLWRDSRRSPRRPGAPRQPRARRSRSRLPAPGRSSARAVAGCGQRRLTRRILWRGSGCEAVERRQRPLLMGAPARTLIRDGSIPRRSKAARTVSMRRSMAVRATGAGRSKSASIDSLRPGSLISRSATSSSLRAVSPPGSASSNGSSERLR